MPSNLPMPTVQTFLTCNEIFVDPLKRATILFGPSAHVPIPMFPAHVRMSIYAEFTGGHGSYVPRLSLRDDAGEEVWGWTAQSPFGHTNPLTPHEVRIDDVQVAVPREGRYSLILLLNGVEAAQRTMWFGPASAFTS